MRTISQLLLTFLINASWQIPLIAALATLCAWLLRHSGARYRHMLWVGALLLSFFLPAITSSRILVDRAPLAAVAQSPEVVAQDKSRAESPTLAALAAAPTQS